MRDTFACPSCGSDVAHAALRQARLHDRPLRRVLARLLEPAGDRRRRPRRVPRGRLQRPLGRRAHVAAAARARPREVRRDPRRARAVPRRGRAARRRHVDRPLPAPGAPSAAGAGSARSSAGARSRTPGTSSASRSVDTPIEELDGEYDVVTVLSVLEHVNEPRAFLREVRRLLKPGGATYLIVPNVDSLATPRPARAGRDVRRAQPPPLLLAAHASRPARARGLRGRRDPDAGRVARPGARVAHLQRAVQRRGRRRTTRSSRPSGHGARTSSGCSRSSTSATSSTASRRSARASARARRARAGRPPAAARSCRHGRFRLRARSTARPALQRRRSIGSSCDVVEAAPRRRRARVGRSARSRCGQRRTSARRRSGRRRPPPVSTSIVRESPTSNSTSSRCALAELLRLRVEAAGRAEATAPLSRRDRSTKPCRRARARRRAGSSTRRASVRSRSPFAPRSAGRRRRRTPPVGSASRSRRGSGSSSRRGRRGPRTRGGRRPRGPAASRGRSGPGSPRARRPRRRRGGSAARTAATTSRRRARGMRCTASFAIRSARDTAAHRSEPRGESDRPARVSRRGRGRFRRLDAPAAGRHSTSQALGGLRPARALALPRAARLPRLARPQGAVQADAARSRLGGAPAAALHVRRDAALQAPAGRLLGRALRAASRSRGSCSGSRSRTRSRSRPTASSATRRSSRRSTSRACSRRWGRSLATARRPRALDRTPAGLHGRVRLLPDPARVWVAIPAVLVAAATAIGVGSWLAALNVKYRDIRFVVPFVLQLWLFGSSVFITFDALNLSEPWRDALLAEPDGRRGRGFPLVDARRRAAGGRAPRPLGLHRRSCSSSRACLLPPEGA